MCLFTRSIHSHCSLKQTLSIHSHCSLSANHSCLLFFLLAHSQLVQGNPGSVSAALQQIQARTQQTTVTTWPIYCSFFPFLVLFIDCCFVFHNASVIHSYVTTGYQR